MADNLKVEKISNGVYRNLATGDIISATTKIYEQIKTEYFKNKKTIIINSGGSRSGKTFGIMQFLVDVALRNVVKINIVRRTLTLSERGVMQDFLDIMKNREIYDRAMHNLGNQIYTFPNGSTICFLTVQTEDDARGIKSHILYLDETTELKEEIYKQLSMRVSKLILLSYNPSESENFWISRILLKKDDNGNFLNKKVAFIKSTFLDNPFISQEIIDSIKAFEPTPENVLAGTADAVRWSIFGLGEYAKVEGRIFEYEVIDELPEELEYTCCGADWGFSPDPSVLVFKGEKKQLVNNILRDCLFFDEIMYETGLISTRNMSNPDIPSVQARWEESAVSRVIPIYADSASPDQIRDLQISGYNVLPVVKTQGADRNGSISYSISVMKSYKIYVTSRSVNLIKELNFYRQEERNGRMVRIGADHAIDCCRYATLSSSPLAYYSSRSKEPVRVKIMDESMLRKYG